MNKLPLTLLFLLFCALGFSQDLIVKKNGVRIYCRILNVDSSEITYRQPSIKDPKKINRADVQEYKVSSSAPGKTANKTGINPEVFLISLFAGQGIPLSDFASKDLQDEKSGLAEDGRSYEGSMILKVSPFFGLMFSYKSQTYGFDEQLICDALTMTYPGSTFRCSSDPWKMRGLFPGIYMTFPFKNYPKLYMDFEVTGGIPKYTYPKLVSSGNPFGPLVTVTSSAPPVRAITACMGLGFSYRLAPAFSFNIHADYLVGKPNFGNITTRSSTGYSSFSSYQQNVTALILRMGFSLIFAQKVKETTK